MAIDTIDAIHIFSPIDKTDWNIPIDPTYQINPIGPIHLTSPIDKTDQNIPIDPTYQNI